MSIRPCSYPPYLIGGLSICWFVHPSVGSSVCPSICQFIHSFVKIHFRLFHLPLYLSYFQTLLLEVLINTEALQAIDHFPCKGASLLLNQYTWHKLAVASKKKRHCWCMGHVLKNFARSHPARSKFPLDRFTFLVQSLFQQLAQTGL